MSKSLRVIKIEYVSTDELRGYHQAIKAHPRLTLSQWCGLAGISNNFLYKLAGGKTSVAEATLTRIYDAAKILLEQPIKGG